MREVADHQAAREFEEAAFSRFPTWMWCNTVVKDGLDLYNMRGSIAAVLDYLDEVDPEAARFLDATQNARLVRSAEQYYRIMYRGGAESWNLRDSHMFETLETCSRRAGRTPRRWSGRTTAMSATRGRTKWLWSAASSILASGV